jgi:cytochrome c oxidase cbb3-type subunit I/II
MLNTHFWLGTLGIVFYAIPMYVSGFTQGLMWKDFNEDGMLRYGNFLDTVTKIIPMYVMRGVGGLLYYAGVILMVYNLWKTAAKGKFVANEEAEAVSFRTQPIGQLHGWHKVFETKPLLMLVGSLIVVSIGGLVQMIPTFVVKENIPTIASVKPYTPLELEGRDLYIREGCNACHTQLVRPFRSETERYGEYSKSGEYVYDHNFLWGSKRTGPDLMRVGKKYPDSWHYHHMREPVSMSPGSIMPPYPWLLDNELNTADIEQKMKVLKTLGVPYSDEEIKNAKKSIDEQATKIVENLKKEKVKVSKDKEIVALIAYLQRLGTDIKAEQNQQTAQK